MVLPAQTVTVAACSGKQGSSVADALLRSQKFTVRGITRDPTKSNCQSLQKRGLQLCQGDLNHSTTLKSAFQGAWGAFLMTDFYDNTSHISETEQGINEIDACVNAGVRNIVYRCIPHASPWAGGRRRQYAVG